MAKPATAMPATSATATIFRWVARSTECMEWFIEASQASLAPIVSPRCTPHLFPPGFIGSSKWFHWPSFIGLQRTSLPSGIAVGAAHHGKLVQAAGWGRALQCETGLGRTGPIGMRDHDCPRLGTFAHSKRFPPEFGAGQD